MHTILYEFLRRLLECHLYYFINTQKKTEICAISLESLLYHFLNTHKTIRRFAQTTLNPNFLRKLDKQLRNFWADWSFKLTRNFYYHWIWTQTLSLIGLMWIRFVCIALYSSECFYFFSSMKYVFSVYFNFANYVERVFFL